MRGRDVGDVFCIYLGTKYADFQEKIFAAISEKIFQTFHCSNVTTVKLRFWNISWSTANVFQNRGVLLYNEKFGTFFPEISAKIFS